MSFLFGEPKETTSLATRSVVAMTMQSTKEQQPEQNCEEADYFTVYFVWFGGGQDGVDNGSQKFCEPTANQDPQMVPEDLRVDVIYQVDPNGYISKNH